MSNRSRAPDVIFRGNLAAASKGLAAFVRPGCPDRLFEFHNSSLYPSENCLCFFEYSSAMGVIHASFRHMLLSLAFNQPFSTPKRFALRLFGASIHPSAYLAPQFFVDTLFPSLLTVEAGVLVGLGVRIALHEHAGSRFRAGRVIIRRGATIGADARIACGVEVGEYATVGIGAVVFRDVPPGAMVVGNPARVMPSYDPNPSTLPQNDKPKDENN